MDDWKAHLKSNDFMDDHTLLVMDFSSKIARRRGLNKETAEKIALYHDVGRQIPNNLKGKHAKVSKKMVTDFLFSDDRLLIAEAIGNHSKKKTIHDEYSELIKDADSLAHLIEFGREIPVHELIRCQMSMLRPFEIISRSNDLTSLYAKMNSDLNEYLSSNFDVHKIRITIRTMRTILWLLDKKYAETDAQLKNLFQKFDYSRKLTVLERRLKSLGISIKISSDISEIDINLKNERSNWNTDFSIDEPLMLDIDTAKLIKNYKKKLMKTDIEQITTLHKLRIYGKKLKYLLDHEIIKTLSNYDNLLIHDIHDLIGDLNDINDYKELISTLSMEFTPAQYSFMDDSLNKQYAETKEVLKLKLFILKKRLGLET